MTIEFRVLGPLAAESDGRGLPLGAPKQRALLAELLLARNATVSRAALVDAVWGSAPPASAATSLQVYVHGLRKALGADRIETHGGGYRLRLGPGELDLERFERLVESARDALAGGDPVTAAGEVQAALALWRGAPLVDLTGHRPAGHGAELDELRLQALELRGHVELELGRHEQLLVELEWLVHEHPYRERFREQQILALYRAGRQKEALDAYREVWRVLNDELGVEPGPALRELERAVLRHEPALDAARHSPGEARLPAPPTPLVGRRLEVTAVAALLRRRDVRLVTLTGTGGAGKTRVALAAGEELARELPGGAVFVDLAPVNDPALLVTAVAQALRVDPGAGDHLEPVLAHLRTTPMLLVLDNLEQLLPAIEPVAALLAGAPRLLVLATSRAPLRLRGEHEYRVPPLPVPPARASFEEAAGNDAVRLFLARAFAVDRTFALTDENVGTIAGICRRLDGLPLALELAAAQTRVLPPAELERRLTGALELLVEGARDLPPRQRTLRATLDWSWRLLASNERISLARLSVFAGGASFEAAEAVLGASAIAHAATLAASGLLRRVEGEPPRLVLLETIREYALERLRARSGLEDETRRRHAGHFLALAERRQPELLGENIDSALAELDRERENLLAALDWAADAGEVETEVRLAVGLQLYWKLRGNLADGRRLFERAISDNRGEPALHARALVHGAVFAFRQGDLEMAREEWNEALGLFRALGDEVEAARCIAELGAAALATGDLDRAEALYREAAAAFAAQGNRIRESAALSNLAEIAAERHDYPGAEALGEQALVLDRELADRDGLAVGLHNLARVKLALGKAGEAHTLAVEALELAAQLGYREVIAYALGTLGELALAAGDTERAARLLGRSEAIFLELGIARYGEEAESFGHALAALAARLGPDPLRELTDAGAALTREQAVAEAIRAPG